MARRCKNIFDKASLTMQELHDGKRTLNTSKRVAINDNVLSRFYSMWGGNDMIYHPLDDKIVWHIRAPNVALVSMLRCRTLLGFCDSIMITLDNFPLSALGFSGLLWFLAMKLRFFSFVLKICKCKQELRVIHFSWTPYMKHIYLF